MTSGEVIVSTLFTGVSLITEIGAGLAIETGAGTEAEKDIVLSLPIAAASSLDLPPINCGI